MPDPTIKPESLLSGTWKPPTADVPYLISTLVASAAVLLIGLLYVLLMLAAALAAPAVAIGVGMADDFQVPPSAKLIIWIGCGVCFPLGLIIAAGMFKAIVPPKARDEEQCVIHRNEEPLLWAVIEQMCRTMGTPVPRRIVVLHNGNAAVDHGPIWRSLLFMPDVSLHIGMPLVGALTLREFLGVMAHEMGHLRQRVSGVAAGAAGRLLQRLHWAAYGMSDADWSVEFFEEYADTPLTARIWIRMLRLGSWIARVICHVLGAMAEAAWSFARRRQEINADMHEVVMSGSAAFESTARRLAELSIAEEHIVTRVRRMLHKKVAPEDIPAMVLDELTALGREGRAMAGLDVATQRAAEWFDAYPETRERVRRARELNEPGLIAVDAPAKVLFGDFELACVRATYGVLETNIPNHLARLERRVTREELREGLTEQLAGRARLAELLGFDPPAWRPVLPGVSELTEPSDPKALFGKLKTARQVKPARDAAGAAEKFRDAHERWMACVCAKKALELKPGSGYDVRGIGKVTRWTVTGQIDTARTDFGLSMNVFDPLIEAAETRLVCALRMLCVKGADRLLPGAAEKRKRADALLRRSAVLRECFPLVRQLREMEAESGALAAATHDEKLYKEAWKQALPHATAMANRLDEIRRLGRDVRPPDESKGEFGEWLAGPQTGPEEFFAVLDNADRLTGRFRNAYERTVGELAEIAMEMERALDAQQAKAAAKV